MPASQSKKDLLLKQENEMINHRTAHQHRWNVTLEMVRINGRKYINKFLVWWRNNFYNHILLHIYYDEKKYHAPANSHKIFAMTVNFLNLSLSLSLYTYKLFESSFMRVQNIKFNLSDANNGEVFKLGFVFALKSEYLARFR